MMKLSVLSNYLLACCFAKIMSLIISMYTRVKNWRKYSGQVWTVFLISVPILSNVKCHPNQLIFCNWHLSFGEEDCMRKDLPKHVKNQQQKFWVFFLNTLEPCPLFIKVRTVNIWIIKYILFLVLYKRIDAVLPYKLNFLYVIIFLKSDLILSFLSLISFSLLLPYSSSTNPVNATFKIHLESNHLSPPTLPFLFKPSSLAWTTAVPS